MINIYKLRKSDLSRRMKDLGHPPTCDCGCGEKFKIGDIVCAKKRSRGRRVWRTPECATRLFAI